MVEGLNAVVRDVYPGSSVSFKPNSPGGGVLAIAEKQADFTATATGTEIRLANEGKDPYKTPLKSYAARHLPLAAILKHYFHHYQMRISCIKA